MIEKQCAIEAQKHALAAITELSQLINLVRERCSPETFEQLKEGAGRSIGEIQMGILEVIIAEFPELDDLK